MQYIYLVLNWGFGGLFLLVGLTSLFKDPMPGLFLIAMSAMLLPPVRNVIYSKSNKAISVKARAFILIALFMMFGYFAQEAGDRRTNELAKQKATEQLAALTKEFNENRADTLSIIKKSMADKDYDKAVKFTDYFLPVNDPDITALSIKAQKAKNTSDLLSKIKTTKNNDHIQLKKIYSQLASLYPENTKYKDKSAYHNKKAIALADQRKKEEARKNRIKMQFSAWNGSHNALERHIKRNMNDPDSYEHVETRYWDRGDHLIVSTTFRGKNAFGGIVKDYIKAKVTLDGVVIETFK